MNTYGALWNGKTLEIKAETTYQAQQIAVAEFQKSAGRKVVKGYQIAIGLLQLNGADYVHTAVH